MCFLHFFQVFLCFGNSVASTRFLLQDEFNIQTTQCDNCIIVLPLSFPLNIYDSMCTHSASLSSTHVFIWHIAFFAGIYVLPPTTCMHIFHSSLYCWKWWTSRCFAGLEHFGWFDLLHVRPYIMHPFEINWPRDMKWWNPVLILLFDLFLQGLCMYAGKQ